MAGLVPLLSGTFYAWRSDDIDSTAEATFPNVVHRSGTNVMRHQATLFEQAVQRFPWHRFDHHVRRHWADDDQRGFNARMHFLALLGGALGGHQGLRPLIAALAPNSGALRLLGGKAPARSTLADANRTRPAELFSDLLQELIGHLHRSTRRAVRAAVRLIDATYMDCGKRMQRWLGLHQGKAAAKLHVVYDPRAQKPVFFAVTPARINDIAAAKDLMPIEPGTTYVFDLGYYDFAVGGTRRCRLHLCHSAEVQHLAAQMPAARGGAGGCVLSDQVGELAERLAAAGTIRSIGRVARSPSHRHGQGPAAVHQRPDQPRSRSPHSTKSAGRSSCSGLVPAIHVFVSSR